MVNSRTAVRRWRSLEESEGGCTVAARLNALGECLLIAPGLHQGCLEVDRVKVAGWLRYHHRAGDLRSRLEVEGVAQRAFREIRGSLVLCRASSRRALSSLLGRVQRRAMRGSDRV